MNKEKVNRKLIKAAKEGDKEAVEKLLGEGADVNAQNSDGNTALHRATENGYDEIVSILLNAKADVARTNNAGQTAITYAANSTTLPFYAYNLDIADLHRIIAIAVLLENGANFNEFVGTNLNKDRHVDRLFLFAVKSNQLQAVKALLRIGADVNYHIGRTDVGTALDIALAKPAAKQEIIHVLLEAGAGHLYCANKPKQNFLIIEKPPEYMKRVGILKTMLPGVVNVNGKITQNAIKLEKKERFISKKLFKVFSNVLNVDDVKNLILDYVNVQEMVRDILWSIDPNSKTQTIEEILGIKTSSSETASLSNKVKDKANKFLEKFRKKPISKAVSEFDEVLSPFGPGLVLSPNIDLEEKKSVTIHTATFEEEPAISLSKFLESEPSPTTKSRAQEPLEYKGMGSIADVRRKQAAEQERQAEDASDPYLQSQIDEALRLSKEEEEAADQKLLEKERHAEEGAQIPEELLMTSSSSTSPQTFQVPQTSAENNSPKTSVTKTTSKPLESNNSKPSQDSARM